MAGRFRRTEVQATYAVWLALISVVPCAAGVGLAWRNYDPVLGQIVYGSSGRFLPVFGGCALGAMGLGAVAFALGWSTILRRRNEYPGRSWAGFLLGGAVLTVSLILVIGFVMIRLEQAV